LRYSSTLLNWLFCVVITSMAWTRLSWNILPSTPFMGGAGFMAFGIFMLIDVRP